MNYFDMQVEHSLLEASCTRSCSVKLVVVRRP